MSVRVGNAVGSTVRTETRAADGSTVGNAVGEGVTIGVEIGCGLADRKPVRAEEIALGETTLQADSAMVTKTARIPKIALREKRFMSFP